MILDIEDAKAIERLLIGPHKYLLVTAPAGTKDTLIESYAYGFSIVSQVYEIKRFRFFIVVVRDEWAQATVDRLASGLFGATIHDSYDEAYMKISELV